MNKEKESKEHLDKATEKKSVGENTTDKDSEAKDPTGDAREASNGRDVTDSPEKPADNPVEATPSDSFTQPEESDSDKVTEDKASDGKQSKGTDPISQEAEEAANSTAGEDPALSQVQKEKKAPATEAETNAKESLSEEDKTKASAQVEEHSETKDAPANEALPESDDTSAQNKEEKEKKPAEETGKGKLESEVDLKEKDDDDHDEEDEEADYSEMSKEELVDVIKDLAKNEEVIKAEKVARDVKHAFDEIRNKERDDALQKFLKDGGDSKDFAFRPDELTLRFDANYQLIRDRKSNFVKNKEEQKEANLRKKEDILERLREFVDSEETNISFDTFKELQEEWKSIGPVPGAIARSLWANYNALVDRFYDKRSIYFELKELDRKKNLESKLELCVRAENLAEVGNINDAIKELNELHHEFKHIGPVPKEEQEPLWQRFKAASDAVYDRRKEFVEKLKGELEENLKVKLALAEKVSEFAGFDSDRIKAWNEKTRELLEIQKKWENTGGLPRARAKEVNRSFWTSFKQFFSNKNQFFKKLDAEREKNLEKKREMVDKAKSLKDSEDWHDTAEKLKALQREWKNVGPVPGKYRESVYKEFKEACDAFFDRKRASQDVASKDYADNYKKKLEICTRIEKLAKGDKNNLDEFKSLQEEYNETGFVPRNKISEIRNRYSEVVNAYVKALDGMTNEEKQRIKIENQVSDILHSPNADQKLYRKEQSLRKQISSIENDIAVWKNNLEFFADSKKANKLKDEFQTKIDSANDELKQLKQQLRIIRTA